MVFVLVVFPCLSCVSLTGRLLVVIPSLSWKNPCRDIALNSIRRALRSEKPIQLLIVSGGDDIFRAHREQGHSVFVAGNSIAMTVDLPTRKIVGFKYGDKAGLNCEVDGALAD